MSLRIPILGVLTAYCIAALGQDRLAIFILVFTGACVLVDGRRHRP